MLTGATASVGAADDPEVVVGSKSFTESVILGEMLVQLAEDVGGAARHRRQLGGTRVLWSALLEGEIDAYPEYTGTLLRETLAEVGLADAAELERYLSSLSISMTPPLGFNNTYAIGVKAELADRMELRRISDLRDHPDLILGFGNEFMERSDGWPGLRDRYRLPQQNVRGLDHDLAYRGLESGALHVTDLYSTDAEIAYYGLRALEDDLAFFPRYDAVVLYRTDLAHRLPRIVSSFSRLAGIIDEKSMSRMNARVKIHGVQEERVANEFLVQTLEIRERAEPISETGRLWQHTKEHLVLVGVSLSAAILLAVPLGIVAARQQRLGQIILGIAGVLQTIPSLALFVFMIPVLGIGGPPAIVALFLYSLLPIVRNTHAGLRDIPPSIIDSARALGLPPGGRLRIVELPMAARSIFAGVKTSAVINVGTATLGALIGAGGYGQPILTGIRLDDMGLILQGAVPAALLALVVQGLFDLVEWRLLPRGLRAADIPRT
ncbi:MAG: amino acid ABC transporter permease [Gammaproteobacteria bacterium SG8_31]|nr:MAG: amino acid ABC transporter permease [Gammaproteobacteria bacterium SG8_31]